MAKHHIQRVLFTAEQIRHRVEALARELIAHYPPGDVIAVAVLKGSFVFVADLARLLAAHDLHLVIDFITLDSYGAGTESSGRVTVRQDISVPVHGRRVLLIDDILDTGLSLQTARDLLLTRGAAEVRACVLLDKPARRRVPITADYIGFVVDDVFVVGYGLDFESRYRHLPYLAALSLD